MAKTLKLNILKMPFIHLLARIICRIFSVWMKVFIRKTIRYTISEVPDFKKNQKINKKDVFGEGLVMFLFLLAL